MSERPFFIYFNFPLENTGKVVCMEAVVEPDQSTHQYNIHSFRNFDGIKKISATPSNILPEIKIKKRQNWVHVDSEKVSVLSSIVGNAIEERKALMLV